MGVPPVDARRKFGVRMTLQTCAICVVPIVLMPPANRKSSLSISRLWINSEVCSPANNISKQSNGNAAAQPRIQLICAVIVIYICM